MVVDLLQRVRIVVITIRMKIIIIIAVIRTNLAIKELGPNTPELMLLPFEP